MRPSRGMGCIRDEKRPGNIDTYKAGGRTKLPQLSRVVGIDRLNKAERATHKMGKQKRGQNNFGNMSKYK